LLAYVQLPNGKFLNEVLLSEGYAYADWRFYHSLYHKYKRLESATRHQKKGLWLNVTLEQMPEWRQSKIKMKMPKTQIKKQNFPITLAT
jgi:endonuclease YncB( thermonuclease family)